MPVVKTKARTITRKIVFMTRALRALGSDSVRMPEPARRSVTGITEQLFRTFSVPGAYVRGATAKYLY